MLRSDQILWLLVSTALVMLTLPGVALFYGGMVRKKNVLNTMGMPLLALAVVSLAWLCIGDALAFESFRRFLGSLLEGPIDRLSRDAVERAALPIARDARPLEINVATAAFVGDLAIRVERIGPAFSAGRAAALSIAVVAVVQRVFQ